MQKRKKKLAKFRSFRPQISILSAINKDTDALGVRWCHSETIMLYTPWHPRPLPPRLGVHFWWKISKIFRIFWGKFGVSVPRGCISCYMRQCSPDSNSSIPELQLSAIENSVRCVGLAQCEHIILKKRQIPALVWGMSLKKSLFLQRFFQTREQRHEKGFLKITCKRQTNVFRAASSFCKKKLLWHQWLS